MPAGQPVEFGVCDVFYWVVGFFLQFWLRRVRRRFPWTSNSTLSYNVDDVLEDRKGSRESGVMVVESLVDGV